jgi:hypothetical protein
MSPGPGSSTGIRHHPTMPRSEDMRIVHCVPLLRRTRTTLPAEPGAGPCVQTLNRPPLSCLKPQLVELMAT